MVRSRGPRRRSQSPVSSCHLAERGVGRGLGCPPGGPWESPSAGSGRGSAARARWPSPAVDHAARAGLHHRAASRRRPRGRRVHAYAAAPLSRSTICTALVAAPFRRLSATTHRWKVRGRSGPCARGRRRPRRAPPARAASGCPGPPAVSDHPGNTTSARRSRVQRQLALRLRRHLHVCAHVHGTRTQVAATARSGSEDLARLADHLALLARPPLAVEVARSAAPRSPRCGVKGEPCHRRAELHRLQPLALSSRRSASRPVSPAPLTDW